MGCMCVHGSSICVAGFTVSMKVHIHCSQWRCPYAAYSSSGCRCMPGSSWPDTGACQAHALLLKASGASCQAGWVIRLFLHQHDVDSKHTSAIRWQCASLCRLTRPWCTIVPRIRAKLRLAAMQALQSECFAAWCAADSGQSVVTARVAGCWAKHVQSASIRAFHMPDSK